MKIQQKKKKPTYDPTAMHKKLASEKPKQDQNMDNKKAQMK